MQSTRRRWHSEGVKNPPRLSGYMLALAVSLAAAVVPVVIAEVPPTSPQDACEICSSDICGDGNPRRKIGHDCCACPADSEGDRHKQKFFNLTAGGLEVEIEMPCPACRRMPTQHEQKLQKACLDVGGQPELCKCFDVLCTRKVETVKAAEPPVHPLGGTSAVLGGLAEVETLGPASSSASVNDPGPVPPAPRSGLGHSDAKTRATYSAPAGDLGVAQGRTPEPADDSGVKTQTLAYNSDHFGGTTPPTKSYPAGDLSLAAAETPAPAYVFSDIDVKMPATGGNEIAMPAGDAGSFGMTPATASRPIVGIRSRLEPNRLVSGNLSDGNIDKYEFSLDANKGAGSWHLRLRQCYGRVGVGVSMQPPSPGAQPLSLEDGRDSDIPLSGDGTTSGSSGLVSLASISAVPAEYELALEPPGDAGLSLVLLPASQELEPARSTRGRASLSFGRATLNRSLLGTLLPLDPRFGGEVALRYTLVVAPRDSTALNPNSSCGLAAAIRSGAVTAEAGEPGDVRGEGEPLPLAIGVPDLPDGAYWANVLVALTSHSLGSVLETRCYAPYVLNVTNGMDSAATLQSPPPPPTSMFWAMVLLAGVGAAWWWWSASYRGSCPPWGKGSHRAVRTRQFELEDRDSDGLLGGRRNNYVPPTV